VQARGAHHVDLAVSDVDRSVAFYLGLLGPLSLEEDARYPTYRGTEATSSPACGVRTAASIGTTASGSSTSIQPAQRETYSNGVRKATYRDPDGNEVGLGGAPLTPRQ
jgi:catechol 2,3-dioxygenase-like lactoylglutathione lyase family enzyme